MIGQELGKMVQDDSATLPDGYKMTELGPLPADWQVVRLGEVLSEIDVCVSDLDVNAEDLPVLSLTKNEGLILQTERFGKRIATEDISNYKVVRCGQIVYNPYVIWEGAVHILQKYEVGIVSPVYPVWKVSQDKADPWFVDHLLRMPDAIAAYNRFASGAVNRRRAIKKTDFLSISIPLPPLPEQRAIAHVLRTVQQAKEASERVVAALKELKKSLMRHLFTYGPVPVSEGAQDAVGTQDAVGARDAVGTRDAVGAQRAVPLLQDTEIGPLPAHWQVVRLGEVASLRQGTVLPCETPDAKYVGLEHLDSGNITIRRFGYAADTKSTKAIFKVGDVLYGKLRPYLDKAALAEWDGVCSTDILVLVPKQVDPCFAAYLMHSQYVLQHAIATTTGVNHPRTSWKALSGAFIPLPPLPEQQEIARILQTVDRRIEAEEAYRRALETLFKTLLHELMTAKRRLPEEFIAHFQQEEPHVAV